MAHHQFFRNIGLSLMEAPLWTPVAKYKQMYSHITLFFSLYTCELNFGQTIWGKTQVLLGTSWGQHFRTLWEFDGNKGKKTKISSPPCPLLLTYLLTYLQFSVIKWAKQCPGQSPIDVKSDEAIQI